MSITQQPPAQKFLFNRSFDGMQAESAQPKAPPPPTFSQEELDAAHTAGEQQGYHAGEAAAQQSMQAQLLALANQIDQRMAHAMKQAQTVHDSQQSDITDIALAIARKLLPPLVAEHTLTSITTMVVSVCKDMAREPRLVVRVHETMLDPLKQQLDCITQQQAYAGKIILLADEALLATDCKIEWSDGGIERDSTTIWQQIDQAVRAARTLAESLPESSSPAPSSFSESDKNLADSPPTQSTQE
jgi:flagellar assembly protein FliH